MSQASSRHFHFLREIASGTFGSVFLAKEVHTNGFSRLVALKLLHRRWSESEEVTRRLRDEARLLGWLRHPNIVDVSDLTSIDGRAAVIMEYLEAADLRMLVEEVREQGEVVPLRAALQVAAATASALDAAYNRPPFDGEKPLRVIHRDIKPGNIMVDEAGHTKVLDFGVARADFDARESSTRDLQFGSVDYMPPERLFFEPETPASDVYSLGATLYEILALEKLGKAKGRPDRHAGFVQDRLSFLRAMRGIGGRLATRLDQVLAGMLAYEHPDRPGAAQVARTCRELAREATDADLHDWAEAVVPPILARLRAVERSDNPLNDRVLAEDDEARTLAPPAPPPPAPPPEGPAPLAAETSAVPAAGDTPMSTGAEAPAEVPMGAPAEEPPAAEVDIERDPSPAEPLAAAPPTAGGAPADPVPPADDPGPAGGTTTPLPPDADRPPPATTHLAGHAPKGGDPLPRMYSTGGFPRVQLGRSLSEPRRRTPMEREPPLRPLAPPEAWDEQPTARVDPAFLEALKAGDRRSLPDPADIDRPTTLASPPAPVPLDDLDRPTTLLPDDEQDPATVVAPPAAGSEPPPLDAFSDQDATVVAAPDGGVDRSLDPRKPAVAEAFHGLDGERRGATVTPVVVEDDEAIPAPRSGRRLVLFLVAAPLLGALLGALAFLFVLPAVLDRGQPPAVAPPDAPTLMDVARPPEPGAPEPGGEAPAGDAGTAEADPPAPGGVETPEAAGRTPAGVGGPAPAVPAPAEATDGSSATFTAAVDPLRRLQVRCTSGEASGPGPVTLPLSDGETCTVTAILEDRSRLVVVLEGAGPGAWTCFADGDRQCVRPR